MSKTSRSLSKEDIIHLAHLAHLTLSDEEIEMYGPQLSSIIEYISKLEELDTKNIEPANQVTGLDNVLREDFILSDRTFSQTDATSNKKGIKKGMFEVDAIFQNE